MDELLFRTGRADDADVLLRFWSIAAENSGRPTDTREAVERLLDRDAEALIVAERDGRVVGTVIAGFDGWRYHLYRLAVDPGERRRGIGRALLERAEKRLVRWGATRLDAMVLADNSLGQAIWATSGFSPQPEWRRWVKPL